MLAMRSAFEGDGPPYVLTTRWSKLSATCFSHPAWLDSCSCHSSRAAFSPGDSGLYGPALQGFSQGHSQVGPEGSKMGSRTAIPGVGRSPQLLRRPTPHG